MLNRLRRRGARELLLASEAFLLLGCFHVALRVVPVRRILRLLTKSSVSGPVAASAEPDERGRTEALRVRWAVLAAARNSPARFVCFPQTLAGYVMLRRRGIRSTIVYGVARSAKGDLLAHTWLTVGERTVVGGEGAEAFSPIDRWS